MRSGKWDFTARRLVKPYRKVRRLGCLFDSGREFLLAKCCYGPQFVHAEPAASGPLMPLSPKDFTAKMKSD